jgi:tetratricopeptide (TPR) repeat protein
VAFRPRSRLFGVLACCVALLGGASDAAGSDALAQVAGAEARVDEAARAARLLEMEVAPGRARFTEAMAMQRYQDAVYDYLVGNFTRAAESFFVLVTTAALEPAGLQWEAEWYLAESLLQMGNPEIAEPMYVTIIGDDGHPFRDEAVRRLLEIYSLDEDASRFDRIYQQEILRGKVAPSDLILYAVGKAFYVKGDLPKAKSYMGELPATSAYYARARYFLGAMLVAQGDQASLADALPYFSEIVELPAETPVDRQVRDLAILAMARVHYEFSQFDKAVEYYGKVDQTSAFLVEKLHELVWSHIKEQSYEDALAAVDVFLLAFPQHRYAADLQLVRGHLLYRENLYEDALGAYEKVIADFTPIRQRFAKMAAETDDAESYFQEILALGEDVDLDAPRAEGQLPAYAVSVMLADNDFKRALVVARDIQQQDEAVSASEKLVDELDEVLGRGAGAIDIASLRGRVQAARAASLGARVALLDAELGWLESAGGANVQVAGLRARLSALASEVGDAQRAAEAAGSSEAPPPGIGQTSSQLVVLWQDAQATRETAGIAVDIDTTGARIDALHATVDQALTRLDRVEASLGAEQDTELYRIRGTFAEQVVEVGVQREQLTVASGGAAKVAATLVQQNFQKLEEQFAASVLGADMGIVNVYWSQWVAVGDERTEVTRQRQAIISELERRFALLQQKLNQ